MVLLQCIEEWVLSKLDIYVYAHEYKLDQVGEAQSYLGDEELVRREVDLAVV